MKITNYLSIRDCKSMCCVDENFNEIFSFIIKTRLNNAAKIITRALRKNMINSVYINKSVQECVAKINNYPYLEQVTECDVKAVINTDNCDDIIMNEHCDLLKRILITSTLNIKQVQFIIGPYIIKTINIEHGSKMIILRLTPIPIVALNCVKVQLKIDYYENIIGSTYIAQRCAYMNARDRMDCALYKSYNIDGKWLIKNGTIAKIKKVEKKCVKIIKM